MKRYKRNKQKMKIKDLQDFQYQRIKQKRKTKDLQDFLDADLESIDYSEKSNKETALEKIMATHIAEEQRYIDEQVKKHHPEYTTPAHEPEELDKKKVFESRDKVMQANVRGIFQWVVNQFERPEMSYRELVQNSRDAETPQIDIKFTFNSREDERKGVLQVDFEDYGTGMDLEERKEFYMKLFNSSKEGNTKKTGRFGIGLVSIFALEPDEFITESCKNGEAWKQHIWDLQENDFKTRDKDNTCQVLLKKKSKRDERRCIQRDITILQIPKDTYVFQVCRGQP
jgi:hypothetical protein